MSHQPDTVCRHSDGTFAPSSFSAVYAEIRRLDQLRDADQKAVAAALIAADAKSAASVQSSKEAVAKAETAQGNVNATQNEFRGSLKDQATTLMPRAEAENTTRELRGLINDLTSTVGVIRSRLDVGPPALRTLQDESLTRSGREEGVKTTWVQLLALAAVASTVGGVIVSVILGK